MRVQALCNHFGPQWIHSNRAIFDAQKIKSDAKRHLIPGGATAQNRRARQETYLEQYLVQYTVQYLYSTEHSTDLPVTIIRTELFNFQFQKTIYHANRKLLNLFRQLNAKWLNVFIFSIISINYIISNGYNNESKIWQLQTYRTWNRFNAVASGRTIAVAHFPLRVDL